jgi:hypothetical protein
MMQLELYNDAALTRDLPKHRLRRGDLVKVVDHHVAPDGTEGYFIEVLNALGDAIAVTTVPAAALKPLREDEVLCARPLGVDRHPTCPMERASCWSVLPDGDRAGTKAR